MNEIILSKTQKILKFGLGAALVVAGSGHLTFARLEFQAQVPTWVPLNPDLTVLLSGVVEIILGLVILLKTKNADKVGLFAALFFIAVFPGNWSQYTRGIDAFGLNSDSSRLIRLLFQPVLCLWALYATGAIAYLKSRLRSRLKSRRSTSATE